MASLLKYMNLSDISRRRELGLLMALGILEGFSWTLIKPMLPLFASSLGAKALLVGAIVAVPPLVQIFTRIQSGHAAARFGKRKMIVASFIVTAVGAGLFTTTKSIPVIFAAQVCVALGESLFWPANWAYVTSLAPKRQQGTLVALVMGVQGVAGIFMPYIGGRIFDTAGFWLNGLIYTVCAIAGLLLAVRLPALEQRPAGAAPATADAGPDAGSAQPAKSRSRRSPISVRQLLAREMVLLAAWSGSIIFFSWGINSAFYSLYVKSLGFTATTVGALLTWQNGFMAVSRLAYARMAERTEVDRTMLIAMFCNAFPLMLLPLVRNLPLLLVVAAVTGSASGIIPAAIKTLYANATSDEERPLAMGIDGVAMNAGALVSPLAAGAAVQLIGIPATFFGGNLLMLIALAASRRISRSEALMRWLRGKGPDSASATAPAPAPAPAGADGTDGAGR